MHTPAILTCPHCGATIDPRQSGGLCIPCLLGDAVGATERRGALGQIGGHELIDVIARGGMGIVYRARQSDPEREVALKALPGADLLSEEARQRFHIEAQAMARLEHPAIAPVHEVGEEDGTPYFTMKLATGGTLAQRIGGYAGRWREIAELIARIAEAVQFAHSHGVLHRDLKPANILFDENGQALVSDFGLAKLIGTDSDLTRTLAMMGTPHYMAPERARKGGGVTTASDVWSLGVILYELLAGHPPFQGENIPAVLRAVAEDDPAVLAPAVPRDLAVITFKALQKDPARRYVTAQNFADDLRRWLAGEPIHARPVALAERALLWAKRKPAIAALSLALALVLPVSAALLAQANRKLRGAVVTSREHEAHAKQELRDALIAQSSFVRQGTQLGQRFQALDLVRRATAAAGPSIELRHEAAAALAQPDLELVGEIARFRPTGRDGRSVAVTPDLRLMLGLGADDGVVALREVGSGKGVWQPAAKRDPGPDDFRLSASGQYAALTFPDHSVEVWDTAANQLLLSATLVPREVEAASRHKCRPFHLHPTLPLCAGVDRAGTAWVHDLATGQRKEVAAGAMKKATGAFLTATGDQLAIATGTDVEFWQIDPPRIRWRASIGNTGELLDAAAVSGATDAVFLTNDRHNREAVVVFSGLSVTEFLLPQAVAVAGAMIPGTKLAATLEQRGRVSAWDARDGFLWWELQAGTGLLLPAESGRSLLMEGEPGRLMQWRQAPERVFREFYYSDNHRRAATAAQIEISPDGRLISTHSNSFAMLWDARERCYVSLSQLHDGESPGASGAFSPDGSAWVVSRQGAGIHRHSLEWTEDGSPRVGKRELVPGSEGQWLDRLSPDGKTWVLRNRGAPFQLWRPDGTAPEYKVHEHLQTSQRLSPTLRFAYSYRHPVGKSVILDARTGQPCGEYTAAEPGFADFSPGEQWLLLREPDAYRFIETGTWQQRAAVPCRVIKGEPADAAISADGTLAAVEQAGDVIELLSLPTGRLLVRLTPPRDIATTGMRFSHDGTRLYVLGLRHRLYEWNLQALREELGKLGLDW